MRIAIVGATGNLGTALLRRLHGEAGVEEVVGIARRAPRPHSEEYRGVRWVEVDLASSEAPRLLREAFAGMDAVVHLAWALQPSHDEPFQRLIDVGGTAAVLAAAAVAGVGQIAVASSVGAYSAASKAIRVDEDWPTGGLHTSTYSRHKAANERAMDAFEAEHPGIVVTRLRPGLVFQRGAATEIAGLFAGPHYPTRWLRALRAPVLPLPRTLIFQAVHADDVADAFWRALDRRAGGAFNIAAEPVLTPERLARAFGARPVTVPFGLLRSIITATWHLRLQRTDAGWLDIAGNVPVMSTERARAELGWTPNRTAEEALAELVAGLADRATVAGSPPLRG
ncbi:NAD-dependent epimerase/dehydratase family protein [Rathayibacter tanaceti]|uniref:NAD-dependent epimerase/dehydratase family protein n=2 Tax=Rathayibacter tanaceti TaxID=1671680 RepID=A0A166I0H1_9MICO|nr:NAD-dependent epimerase/dehydratase family protein [Rathayibacter tanaceti]KZX21441.1 UDP-glucose 4-epimerase [Rathayibacter tanaceti]QHC54348.1 NAD-dependent epimerase/dehydratase family protein [Rathayibacter tanaceti]TCO38027.1 nucleoside-diphosphate-sugar epimerase [Rathayibacter tanaceti]